MTAELAEAMEAKLKELEQRLTWTKPHECKHCTYYDCNRQEACRCHCGRLHEEIQLRIEELRMLIGLARGEKSET